MQSLFLLITGGTILTIGDLVMRQWLATQDVKTYALGMAIYLVGLNCLVQGFRDRGIAAASALFIIFNLVSLAIAGFYLFGEKISPMQWVGFGLAFAAVLCLESGR